MICSHGGFLPYIFVIPGGFFIRSTKSTVSMVHIAMTDPNGAAISMVCHGHNMDPINIPPSC